MRFIANLKYGQWVGRVALEWNQSSGGEEALKSAMQRIETLIGPSVSTAAEFSEKAKIVFQKAGFQIVRD